MFVCRYIVPPPCAVSCDRGFLGCDIAGNSLLTPRIRKAVIMSGGDTFYGLRKTYIYACLILD